MQTLLPLCKVVKKSVWAVKTWRFILKKVRCSLYKQNAPLKYTQSMQIYFV